MTDDWHMLHSRRCERVFLLLKFITKFVIVVDFSDGD